MTTVVSGSYPAVNSDSDVTINGLTVGKGAGDVSTNTAVGSSALQANTTGSSNTTLGYQSSYLNTTGAFNVAVGVTALYSSTTSAYNTALGYQSGYSQDTGLFNVFIGRDCGYSATGSESTFVGHTSGYYTTGSYNTFLGRQAGYLVTTGTKNSVLGSFSGNQGGLDIRTASNYIVLSDGDGVPRLYIDTNGNLNCQKVYDTTTANAVNVHIRNDGFLLRSTSALKYKQNIRDLENIDINKFRPVRYKSKSEMDDQTKDHFGIVADEVAEAGITELVSYGADGEVEGFQYERFTVVLLKALQELNAKVTALEAQLGAK
jgi:hypothetical protein